MAETALMPYQDYAPSGFSQFVTGMNEGWKNMQDRMKSYYELKQQQLASDAADKLAQDRAANKGKDGGVTTTTAPGMDTGGSNPSTPGTAGGAQGGGEWGKFAAPVVNYFKSQGWSDAAIQGAMANGMAEGGFATPWKEGDGGTSFGHWQFHYGGEMGGYQQYLRDQGLDPKNDTVEQDSVNQAKYLAYRMNQIDPDYGKITDARQATDLVQTQFEKPKNNAPGTRYSYLPGVQTNLQNMQPPTANMPVGSPQLSAAAPDYSRAMSMPIPSAAGLGAPAAAIGAPPAAAPAPAPAAAAAPATGQTSSLAPRMMPQTAAYVPPSARVMPQPGSPAGGYGAPSTPMPAGSYMPSAQSTFAFNGQPPVFQPGVGPGNPPTMALGGPGGPQLAVQQPPPGQPDVWNQPQQPQQQYALVPVNSGLWTG